MKPLAFGLLLVLAMSSFTSIGVPLARVVGQSSQNSCNANNTLTIAINGGVPNSFNGINTFTTTGGFTERLSYLSIYPPPSFTGVPYYHDSIVDWYNANSNYTQWFFNVQPGLKWSDGTNVSASDIVNTFSKQFALNASADVQGLRLEITKVSALNSSEAEFVLNQTDAHLPEKLSGILYSNVMPSSFISHGSFFNGFNGVYPADGPFVIQNYAEGAPQITLTPNPEYSPAPGPCKIVIDYVESQSEVSTLLAAGTADMGAYVPYADISNLMAHSSSLQLVDQKDAIVGDLSYNVTIYPYNMTAFRQALMYGINETQINQEAFAGYASNAYSSQGGVPSTTTAWYSPNQHTYSYNTTMALQLLNSIGIKQNVNKQLTYPNGTVVTLALWSESDYDADVTAQSIVQQNLDSLGFNIVAVPATLQSNLIGDSYANTNGINSALVINSDEACDFGMPFLDALTVYQVCLPLAAPPTWEMPPPAQVLYKGNVTALQGTANATLEYKYLANIQALNAQYLPVIVFNYADAPIMISTSRFTNWPSSNLLDGFAIQFNNTAIASLQPISGATTSTTTTGSPTGSATTTTSAAATTSTATSTSSSTSTTSNSNSLLYIAAAVVIIVIVIAAVAAFVLRRRPAT